MSPYNSLGPQLSSVINATIVGLARRLVSTPSQNKRILRAVHGAAIGPFFRRVATRPAAKNKRRSASINDGTRTGTAPEIRITSPPNPHWTETGMLLVLQMRSAQHNLLDSSISLIPLVHTWFFAK